MGQLLNVLAYDRNALKESAAASIAAVQRAIVAVQNKENLTAEKALSNIRGACASYLGLFRKDESEEYVLTDVARWYLRLHDERGEDAWRWLLSRSLWRYVIPNGTGTAANAVARSAGLESFQFFRLILQVLRHLSGFSHDDRYLSYEEFCLLFDADENWKLPAWRVAEEVVRLRNSAVPGLPRLQRKLLDDLEAQYTPGKRDNLNTWFNKAFAQTGLFRYAKLSTGAAVGIALRDDLDPVLLRRVAFIIDNPVTWRAVE